MKKNILFIILFTTLIDCVNAKVGEKNIVNSTNEPVMMEENAFKFKELNFKIPHQFKSLKSKNFILNAYDKKTGNVILLSTLNLEKFDKEKVLNLMDSICYNLDSYKLIATKNEEFYQWNKDYAKRYYENKKGEKLISYTFYSIHRPYCFLFSYQSEKDKLMINEVIDSITIEASWWEQVKLTFKYSQWCWAVLCAFFMLKAIIAHDKNKRVFREAFGDSILAGVISLVTIWGEWIMILSFMGFIFFYTFLFAILGGSDDGDGDGIDIDFD